MQSETGLLNEQTANHFLSPLSDLPESEQYPLLLSFYDVLLKSQLFVPLLKSDNGEFHPFSRLAFTHLEAFQNWADQTNFAVASFSFIEICNRVIEEQEERLILNLSGPYGCMIEVGDLLYLQNGFLPPPRIGI
jgi:hypothetical protein